MHEEPERLILVTGPRQTGKTTAALQALKEVKLPHHYVAVDEPDQAAFLGITTNVEAEMFPSARRDVQWLVRVWKHSRIEAKRSNRGFVLVIDEIQQISTGHAR